MTLCESDASISRQCTRFSNDITLHTTYCVQLYKLHLAILTNCTVRPCRLTTERDCYIGPVRDAPYCNCAESPIDECHACRLTWSWYDRSEAMSWWNWQNRNEPNEFQCARVTSDGWASVDCLSELRYVCERGDVLDELLSMRLVCTGYCNLLISYTRT